MRRRRVVAKPSLPLWALPAAGVVVWLGLLAFLMPYDPDEAVYKVVAQGLLDGQWPYKDIFDHKAPLTYAYYIPAGLGASIEIQRLIAAAAVGLSFPALASIASTWLGKAHVRAALLAYALLLINPFVSLGANTEAFMLLPLTAAVATASPMVGGVLLGVAVMTKAVALAFLPLLFIQWGRRAWLSVTGLVIVIAAVSSPFAPVWRDYWDANVMFNLEYGAHIEAWRRAVGLFLFNPLVLLGMLPVWYLAVRGASVSRDSRCLAWLGCAYLSVKLGGYDFAHYYALISPPAALLAAAGTKGLSGRRFLLSALAIVSAVLVAFAVVLSVVSKVARAMAA